MAKRRTGKARSTVGTAARKPSDNRSSFGVPLRVAVRLVLVIAVGVAAVLFGPRLVSLGSEVWEQLLVSFGLGIVLLAVAIGVLIRLIWSGFGPLRTHWNVFVGGILVAFGVWGLLSLARPAGTIFWQVTLGGRFGQEILGSSELWGAVRVGALLLTGLVFIVPRRW